MRIFESQSDTIKLPSGKYINESDPDSLPFLYYKRDFYIGEYSSTHGDMIDKIEEETGDEYADIWKKTVYRGRIWTKSKIISFWDYPSKHEFNKIIDDLEDKLKKEIWHQEYQIEIEKSKYGKGKEWEYNHPDYEKIEVPETQVISWSEDDFTFVKFIPIEWYSRNFSGSKPKLTLQQRQLMYSEKKVFESSGDFVNLPNGRKITHESPDAIPFVYYDGELYVGEKSGNHNDMFYKIEDDIYGIKFSKIKNQGRIWTKHKVISFWDFPKKYEFDRIINDLEDKLKIEIWNNNYIIEISKRNNGKGWKLDHPDFDKFESKEKEIKMGNIIFSIHKFIPIEWYSGKRNINVSKPKLTLQQRQLMYSEHMITNFNLFEKEITPEEFGELSWVETMNFKYGSKPVKINTCFHVTPLKNVNDILKHGLTPQNPPTHRDWEPTAIYLSKSTKGATQIARQLFNHKRNLMIGYGVKEYKTDWVILKVNTKDIQLYRDPASVNEDGVYTLESIPPENIMVYHTIDYDIIRSNKNWSDFWNWWFWERTDIKPDFVKKFKLPKPKLNNGV
jgi:hypothetical protein